MDYELMAKVEDATASLINIQTATELTEDKIREMVIFSIGMPGCPQLSAEEVDYVAKKLETRFDITMKLGEMFEAEYRPWLNDARGKITWYFWNRYRRFIGGAKRFSPNVVQSLDSITDQILDHLENPNKDGLWQRRGLVVGHVQSGKTANYTGLICKAADSGYRVIIVLAGLLNSLRSQTQERIEEGFVGRSTRTSERPQVGVGEIDQTRSPVCFTNYYNDFKDAIANQIGLRINDLKEPAVFVVKKNKRSLNALLNWLQNNNLHRLRDLPMLLIDDEADHASINTHSDPNETTAINQGIRELLEAFGRAAYVGYTATPFANIFINPNTKDEMLGDDLFPRNFILSLDAPSNYIGPNQIFGDDADPGVIKEIDDVEQFIPSTHNKDYVPPENLPDSLMQAVRSFVLIKTARAINGQNRAHNSMMVNITRFTAVHGWIRLRLERFLTDMRAAIVNNCGLPEIEALKNSEIAALKELWETDFVQLGISWSDIQTSLHEAVSQIEIIEVNASSRASKLDYSSQNYPNGHNVIAVGGLGLSRGLTLEGLTVSYFLRNSVMYDTLMQMGRWFGYRDGYDQYCRIFMTDAAVSWYSHIAGVMDELRDELRRMKAAGMTPKDFGLCVRNHPDALIITAVNKMRSGQRVIVEVGLDGRLVETSVLLNDPKRINMNFHLLEEIIEKMNKNSGEPRKKKLPPGWLWNDVSSEIIKDFVKNFAHHPASLLTDPDPLVKYIDSLHKRGIPYWNVSIYSPSRREGNVYELRQGVDVNCQKRTVIRYGNGENGLTTSKRRIGFAIQEGAGLTVEQIEDAKFNYLKDNPSKKSVPGSAYRAYREKPLLMLHVLNCCDQADNHIVDLVAYGISSPGDAGKGRPKDMVTYTVNRVWWDTYFGMIDEDEDNPEPENEENRNE
jgi:hypothetical protein